MPLPFARSAPQARPTFSRDFAGLKTLDHGVGPAISFTRGSNATYFNAAGTLTTATTNEPRFDHSSTGSSLGLLIEESRTNSIRNSQAGGSTNGVIGSGGVLPTFWNASGHTTNGISTEIIGTGTESGLTYVDIKVNGTPTATASAFFNTENAAHIIATDGQTWTSTAYVKLAGGSVSNAALFMACSGRDSGGSGVSGQTTSQPFIPTSSALAGQRVSATRTFSSASVVRVLQFLQINYTSGNPIDLTLRIAAPQLEQGAFATSYIPTTTAAATRAADSAVVTPVSSFYNVTEGTLFSESSRITAQASPAFPYIVDFIAGSGNDFVQVWQPEIQRIYSFMRVSSATQFTLGTSSITQTNANRIISAVKENDFAVAVNGAAPSTDALGSLIGLPTSLRIAGSQTSNILNGHIRRIAYWPRRLSNALLQQLTT